MFLKSRQEEILESRLEALRRSLTTTDRVLSGRDVKLTFDRDSNGESPAKSAGDRITLNLSKIPDIGSSSALVHMLGLNYHEVGHVRYGIDPDNLTRALSKTHPRFLEAYRIIEEARVETLLAAKYAKMKKYFAYPVIEHFVKDEQTWGTAFLYTHGRRYLPLKIRETFRDIFTKLYGGANEFGDLIDKYRVLVYTDRVMIRTGAELIDQFAELMDRYRIPVTSNAHFSTDRDRSPDGDTSKDYSDEETQEESDQAAQQSATQDQREEQGEDGSGFSEKEEEEKEEEGGESEDGSGEKDDSGDDGEEGGGKESQDSGGGQDQEDADSEQGSGASSSGGSGDADQDAGKPGGGGSGQGEDGDSSASAGEGRGAPNSSGGGAGKGNGTRSDHRPTAEELREKLAELQGDMQEALETVLANEDVRTDVSNLQAAMEDQSGLSSVLERHGRADKLTAVTPAMLRQADQLKEVLRKIWAQMEPGWNYGLSEGNRLDMSRAALAQDADDYDSIYADWQEGQQDNAGLEVVICADESGSMTGALDIPGEENMRPVQRTTKAVLVSQHVWELLYALQEVDAQATVFAFEDESRVLYDRTDRVTTNGYVRLTPRGCTDPSQSLAEAKRIFTMSEMPNKMLICISDGVWDWDVRNDCGAVLDQMDGVVKVSILVDNSGSGYGFDLADKFHVVQRTDGPIFDVMAEATTKLVEGNLST